MTNKKVEMLEKVGKGSLKVALFIATYKPLIGMGLNCLLIMAIAAFPALAQSSPNPWGGSGTSRLANVGSNVLVIGTWVALFVGILSFLLIPLFIKMEWDYMKLIMSGATGLGGFAIIGSIAYDIVNLGNLTMPDPTIGR